MKRIFLGFLLSIVFTSIINAQDNAGFNYEYALIEAVRQKTLGNVNEAIKLYKRCLEIKPDSDVAAYELGSIYAALNQKELAKTLLKKAYFLKKDNYWYLVAYSQILNFSEEYEELIYVLNDYLKENNDFRMALTLAEAYFLAGKEKKSLKLLDKLGREYGISEQLILKKVEVLKSLDKFDLAQKELSVLIQLIPESPEYQVIMAEFLEEIGKMNEALSYYHEAYNLDSTNIYAISNLADYYTGNGIMDKGLYFLNRAFTLDEVTLDKKLSTFLYFMGEEDTLKKYNTEYGSIVQTLLEKYPDNFEVKTLAYDYFNRTEDYERSYELILELLKEKEDNFLLWQQAIYTASVLERYDNIIELGNKALTIFPNKRDIKLFMGIAYFQKNEFDTCYHILSGSYEEGMEMNLQIQYLTFLGESAYRINRISEAFYFFEELLLLQPDNHLVMNNYAYYMALENMTLARAEELSRKAIVAFPESATYLDTYAWILFKMERYEEALAYMEKFIEDRSEDPEILFHYAWILCKNEEKSRSIIYFEKAREKGYKEIQEIEKALRECN